MCPSCRNIHYKKPCPECGTLIQAKSDLCLKCEDLHRTALWNKRKIYHHGYILVIRKDHPNSQKNSNYIFEHIIVMEQKLGRYLKPNENVHHKNGIRNDNRIENLELWTRPQPVGIRTRDAIIWAKEVLKLYGENENLY